jgi:ubiquinone/menaquinone biosynthesis C-methylase UbiE
MTDHRVFNAHRSRRLDGFWRRIIQNPGKILNKYVREGMTALDVGCGPGYFTVELAKLVGDCGKVIAADLQQEMLDKVREKIAGKDIERRVILHKAEADRIGVGEKVDFALVFYVAHEVPDQKKFFEELAAVIKKEGRMLLVEPDFEVTGKEFKETVRIAEAAGFRVAEDVKIFLSKGKVLERT